MQEKTTVRRNVPYCYLCYGKLRDNLPISKIHADHIEAYSSGNASKFSNILLAHPKCNSEKKNMTLDEYRVTTKSINRRRRQKKNIPVFRQALKNWNKEYKLDIYSRLMKFAKTDLVL
jgi:5-methylcytosine-specific restriction endonuclease McrA